MKKLTVISLLIMFLHMAAYAQPKADSLAALLDRDISTEEKISVLNQLAWELNYANPDQAKAYAREAIELSRETGNMRGLAIAYRFLTVIHQNISKYEMANSFADSAAHFYLTLNDSLGLAGIYNSRGTINYYQSNFAQALRFYEMSYSIISWFRQKNACSHPYQ